MATPRSVSKKLRDMLGMEAAETMVDWLDGLETHNDALGRELHGEIAALRQEMAVGFSELRAEMRAGFAAVDAKLAEADAKTADRISSLLRWMIGFWLGSLAGIITAIITAAIALGHVSK
jgi:hypothetical protein